MIVRIRRKKLHWERGAAFKYLYMTVMFWMMCASVNLSFTWRVPTAFSYALAIIACIGMLYFEKAPRCRDGIILEGLLIVLCIYLLVVSPFSVGRLWGPAMTLVGVMSILRLPEPDKRRFLDFITNGIVLILCFSLFGWALYLGGVHLPHTGVVDVGDNFHYLYNYYLFTVSQKAASSGVFPRFSSVFLEPGQLAAPCAILLFAGGDRLAVWKRIVLIVAILLSFSLVGIAVLLGGYGLKLLLSGKHRFLKIIGFLAVLIPLGISIYAAADESNPIYSRIFMRLEYDEDKGISGNNRTTEEFDQRFEQMMHSNSKWFGIARSIGRYDNLVSNTSGYKKFIVFYGLIGLILLWAFHLYLLKLDWCPASFILFVVLLVLFIPRSMLLSPLWEFPAVLGFRLLGAEARRAGSQEPVKKRQIRFRFKKAAPLYVEGNEN